MRRTFSRENRYLRPNADFSWPATTAVLLAIPCIEYWKGISNGGVISYACMLIASTLAIALDGRNRTPELTTRWKPSELLGVLFVVYLSAIYLFTWASVGRPEDSLVLVVGASLLIAAPVAYRALPPKVRGGTATRTWNSILALLGTTFAVLGALDVARAPLREPPSFFNHETVFIAVAILCLPPAKAFLPVKITTCVALLMALIHYPAATSVLGLVIAAGTFFALKRFGPEHRPKLIALIGLATFPLFLVFDKLVENFYSSVGRVSNSGTREQLWQQAWRSIQDEPIFGSLGRETITGFAVIRGTLQPVPFHNSFLTLIVFGGCIAAGALFLLIAMRLIEAARSSRDEMRNILVWAPALTCATFAMTVNPVLDNAVSAVPFYLILVISTYASSDIGTETERTPLERGRRLHRA